MLNHNFRQLRIRVDSVELTKAIYQFTQKCPGEHKFGLSSQLYRAAVSIPSNIAEGSARKTNKDFSHFLTMSLGSAFELETQMIVAQLCAIVPEYDYQNLIQRIQVLQKQISAFIDSLQ
ncbi:four helix bundle protein [Mucilaginibacter sp. 21P]|uniref:four helix bundle protein n=1 Tax=Mucilaginibacter sp. 21P TaxID=2778902 RepID=UPI001C58B59D|nr:four helix bundle protein [Mucilaginibacter sp. 21P]QXV66981.1 four helix bundle protein [Mucilaginibacter sp. 21P]